MIRIFRHYISRAYLGLIIIESLVFFVAMYLGSKIRFLLAESWYTDEYIIFSSFIFSIILTLSSLGLGLYRRSSSWENYNLIRRICLSFLIGLLIIVALYYLFPEYLIARSVLIYAYALAALGMVVTRYFFYKYANLEKLKRRILVVGSGEKARSLISLNEDLTNKGFTIVGFLKLPGETSVIDEHRFINAEKRLFEISEELKIDEIIIALDDKRQFMPLSDLLDCKMSGMRIMDNIAFYEQEKGIISLEDVNPSWLVFSDGFAQGDIKTIVKRITDLIVSLLILPIAFPFMLITAIAIFLEGGYNLKSIIYWQKRVGENNKEFIIYKFRSMYLNAEQNGQQMACENDTRITPVGRIIRKIRFDELPQIINVLKGDMSFVGPRPERPHFVKEFEKSIPYYRERHRVKPGITGWAQLCYPYTDNEAGAIQKLQYDLYYVKNYSLFLDLSILFHTVEVVLFGKGSR